MEVKEVGRLPLTRGGVVVLGGVVAIADDVHRADIRDGLCRVLNRPRFRVDRPAGASTCQKNKGNLSDL